MDGERCTPETVPQSESPQPEVAQPETPQPETPQSEVLQSETPENDDDCRTVSYYDTSYYEPVVGWLVCVKGKSYGASFNLYAGRNEIGRSAGMDVSLPDEPTVSHRAHAVMLFDPRNKQFFLQQGEGHGLCYLNGAMVMQPQQLRCGDVIRLGDVVLLFVALCGDQFDWNDTEKFSQ